MNSRNMPVTVQLGRGANIQLSNAVINTGTGATIQFGSVDYSAFITRTAAPASSREMPARGRLMEPYHNERLVHSARQPAQPAIAAPVGASKKRGSVFERLTCKDAPVVKRIITGRQVTTVPVTFSAPHPGSFAPGRYDAEASSSGGKLSRRQKRRHNAELRAQGLLPELPASIKESEPVATVPTKNKFSNLRWIRRNSPTAELKQSFWEREHQAPVPQKRKTETLSARVHNVLKVVKERGLMKRRVERPFTIRDQTTQDQSRSPRRTEYRDALSRPLIRESTNERSRHKGKEILRSRPHKEEKDNKMKGIESGAHPRKSAFERLSQKWVPKQKAPMENLADGRHLGESSRVPRHQKMKENITTPDRERIDYDLSPRVEEVDIPHEEPEIFWRRRSDVRLPEDEEDDDDDTIGVEIVYMVEHAGEPSNMQKYS